MNQDTRRFELIELRTHDHAVRDVITGEVMHPSVGPWKEANLLYVGQSRLAERLDPQFASPLHVWDVGLGAGTNVIALLEATRAHSSLRRPIHITSFDTTLEALALALANPQAFPFMTAWREAAEAVIAHGVWEGPGLQWKLFQGNCSDAWEKAAPAQLVYFDPFSPESNPELWTVSALTRLRLRASHADEGTVLFTYSASTRTRVSLLMAGFFVSGWASRWARVSKQPWLPPDPSFSCLRWEADLSKGGNGLTPDVPTAKPPCPIFFLIHSFVPEVSTERMRALRLVYSVLFWSFFMLSCVPLFLGALFLFLVTYPFDRNRLVLHLYSCAWAQLYFWVNPFWHLRIEGREKLPWKGAAVLAANHESLGDILVLFGLYRPFKWVSKASVFKAPFLGWNMRLNGYVPLVRGDRGSISKMMAECEGWLRRQVPVLLFPEGTRSPDGNLQHFKDGAFRLAIAVQCPIIPIALVGTRDTLPKQGVILEHRANCRVQILEPLQPADFGNDLVALREATRDRIRQAREAMMASGR